MKPWSENDDLFRQELGVGHKWATLVATRLRLNGLRATVTPMRWRTSIAERGDFADEHDIDVHGPAGDIPLEVKSRRYTFTDDPRTYPFPTAFLDTVSGWEQKTLRAQAVVIVSQATSGMVVVPVYGTRARWTVESTFDRIRGTRERSYGCPIDLLVVPFAELIDSLACAA